MDLKILCTADLHLGRRSAVLNAPSEVDLTAVGAWKRIVLKAIFGGAHAVVIAGDIFDSTGSVFESRSAFEEGLVALEREGIPVVGVAGNHDWEALPRFARLCKAPNFHVLGLGGEWEYMTLETRGGTVAFVGWSFPSDRVLQCAFDSLTKREFSCPLIGVVHGEVSPKSNYHPMSLSDLSIGDAWVIGHIHAPALLTDRIIYPGSPQAFDFGPGERGPHGVRWLRVGTGPAKFQELEPISSVRFEEGPLRVPGQTEDAWFDAIAAAEERCKQLRTAQPGLESVQMRCDCTFDECPTLPKLPESHEPLTDGSAILFTSFSAKPALDPWDLVSGRDAAGEAARLLLGAKQEENAMEEWVQQAERLVDLGATDALIQYRRTLGQVQDGGDATRPEPDERTRRVFARETLIRELESMLETAMEARA
ncbi:MAG TPA: DNA repair exonuclease [Fimbriimonas sp.]|nr:DNA repair exonuclease [Fimbriimonas sp.]